MLYNHLNHMSEIETGIIQVNTPCFLSLLYYKLKPINKAVVLIGLI